MFPFRFVEYVARDAKLHKCSSIPTSSERYRTLCMRLNVPLPPHRRFSGVWRMFFFFFLDMDLDLFISGCVRIFVLCLVFTGAPVRLGSSQMYQHRYTDSRFHSGAKQGLQRRQC